MWGTLAERPSAVYHHPSGDAKKNKIQNLKSQIVQSRTWIEDLSLSISESHFFRLQDKTSV